MLKDIILVTILFLMAHLTIGRAIGAVMVAGACPTGKPGPAAGRIIWYMMLFWVRPYFYALPVGGPWERRLKASLMLLILLAFELVAIKWLQGYMAIGWAILITFIVENILSFPLFILLRCPGYKLLQRGW